MEKKDLLLILKDWNIWEKRLNIGEQRTKYINKIFPYFERKEILVIKGIRRCGKSTIIKQLMYKLKDNGVNSKQILYINLEDYRLTNELSLNLFDEILETYKKYSNNNNKIYFFIDEIQKIESWEKWIRTKYDQDDNIKFIVSGSNANLLSKELSTLLTGRNISFEVFSLTYNEAKSFNKNLNLNEYLEFGGFPEIVLEKDIGKKKVLLRQYFEDILYKDIIDRHNIRNSKQLFNVGVYLLSNPGIKISLNKLSKVYGISKDTVSSYVNYFIDSYLLFEVPYFSYSAKVKHDVSKLPKLYVLDNGLINIVTTKYSKNKGNLIENSILIKLKESSNEINYWSDKESEVDFITNNYAINVTATNKIPLREFKGLENFKKKFKTFKTLLISEISKNKDLISIEDFLSK